MHCSGRVTRCAWLLLMLTAPAASAEALGAASAPLAGSSPNSIASGQISEDCLLITFEGLADDAPIPTIVGDVTVTFGSSWRSIIDADAGGTGNFANEPTPDTAAYYLSDDDVSIDVFPPVQFVGLFFSASSRCVPITLTAFDAESQVIDTAQGETIGSQPSGASCAGDPTGDFCLWDAITLNSAADNIVRIEITGSPPGQIGFDNMHFCGEAQAVGACCLPAGICAETSERNCLTAQGIFFPNQDCDAIACGVTPVAISTWSLIKAGYR